MKNTKTMIESSSLPAQPEAVTPQQLLCACCCKGGGTVPPCCAEGAERLVLIAGNAPDSHIKLVTAFDEAGARNHRFDAMKPQERKRDLDILQKLGLTPETVKTPRVLYELIAQRIPEPGPICGQCARETDTWRNCPLAACEYYAKGLKSILPKRSVEEMRSAKERSCACLHAAAELSVRAHHLLCMLCFAGSGTELAPLEEDNLFELLQKILENPQIPIVLREGAGECIVCPPCHAFDEASGLCVTSPSLRDRRKDLAVLERLALDPGDRIPAKDLLARIAQEIPNVSGICLFEQETAFEWSNCQTLAEDTYEKGLAYVCQALGI